MMLSQAEISDLPSYMAYLHYHKSRMDAAPLAIGVRPVAFRRILSDLRMEFSPIELKTVYVAGALVVQVPEEKTKI